MNESKVSIVIPTYNRSEYLKECIESCLKQTVECEIIVCDHGSSDNTSEMIKDYGDRIIYVRRDLDSGVHFCWLDGILHAKNEWVHLNFDDDWLEPTFIERTEALISDKLGAVFTNSKLFFEDENRYCEHLFFEMETGVYSSMLLEKFNIKSLSSPCAAIFRKQILCDVLFQGKIPFSRNTYRGVGPDILFSLFACKEYEKFGFVFENLAIFRAHGGSITVDAQKDELKKERIRSAYDDARIFFLITLLIDKIKLYKIMKGILRIKQKRK